MYEERRTYFIGIVFLIVCIIFVAVIGHFYQPDSPCPCDKPTKTIVSIVPARSCFSIYCQPNQPIKGFELGFNFSKSIRIDYISEGNIFIPYQTFFNPGIIDNANDTVIHLYGLILGKDQSTTEAGSFADVHFTRLTAEPCQIELFGVGVTNSTAYIDIDVFDDVILTN